MLKNKKYCEERKIFSSLCVHELLRKELVDAVVVECERKRHWTTKKEEKAPYITESIIPYQNFSRYFFSSFLSSFLLIAVKCISYIGGMGLGKNFNGHIHKWWTTFFQRAFTLNFHQIFMQSTYTLHENFLPFKVAPSLCVCLARCFVA